jgi:putative ABC transport system ATP-binding protein
MTEHHAPDTSRPLWRVGQLLVRLRAELQTIVIYAVAIGLLSLATPIAVQVLINTIAFGGVTQPLIVVAVLLALALALSAFFRTAQTIVVEMLSRRIFVETAARFANNLAIEVGRSTPPGKLRVLTNRFYDVVTLEKALWSWLLDGAAALLQIPLGLALLALYHPFLLAFGLAITVTALFIVFVLGRGAVATAIGESHEKHRLVSRLEEISEAPSLFVGPNGREHAMGTILKISNGWLTQRESHFRILLRQMVGFWALEVIASASLLIIGGGLVIGGQLTLGQLVAAELVLALTVGSLSKIAKILPKVYDAEASLAKLASITDLNSMGVPNVPVPSKKGPGNLAAQEIVLGVDGKPLTEAISFRLPEAGVTHFVGSTAALNAFCAAIYRRSPILSGKLQLGDRPIEMWGPDELFQKIHFLSDHLLRNRTIVEQLCVGAPDTDDVAVSQALGAVGLGQIVASLRRTGDDPRDLSEDLTPEHRFAVAVARAIIEKPAIVICPPALAGLSPIWRQHLTAILSNPSYGWSCLFLVSNSGDAPQSTSTVILTHAKNADQPEVLS